MKKNHEKTPNLVIPDADRRLREICEKGLTKRFGDDPPAAVKERLELELKTVAENQHSSGYLLGSLLAEEATRLKQVFYLRGAITSSLIAYTSGMSEINPMEPEYGGINLPFEITGEMYDRHEPYLELECSMNLYFYAAIFLDRMLPDYRCVPYISSNDDANSCCVLLFFIKQEELPVCETISEWNCFHTELDLYYFSEYFCISLIGTTAMDLVRYNTFFGEKPVFDESNADSIIPQLWEYEKRKDERLNPYTGLSVNTYENLITVWGMSLSSGIENCIAYKMVLHGNLSLENMISTREELFLYFREIGFNSKEAYIMTTQVRKGKQLTDAQLKAVKENGAPDWVIDLCMNIKYMFPRSHIAQVVRADVFRLQEPKEYRKSIEKYLSRFGESK